LELVRGESNRQDIAHLDRTSGHFYARQVATEGRMGSFDLAQDCLDHHIHPTDLDPADIRWQ
jgi:hypothetical protein